MSMKEEMSGHASRPDKLARRRLPQRPSESGAILNALARSSPIGIYIVQAGKFQYVNPRFEEILGYSRKELLDTFSLSYVYTPDRDFVIANAVRALKGDPYRYYHPYEYRIVTKSGEIKWVMETVNSIHYQGERATLGNFMDIDERKRAEEELTRRTMDLQRASQAKSEFLARMSHELRTPLNAIIGFSQLILDGVTGEITEQQRDYITDILGSGEHLLNLINDVLDLSKLEAGKMVITPQTIELADVIHELVQNVRSLAEKDKHTIKVSMEDGLPKVSANKVRLSQIFLNLLSKRH